MKKVLLTLLIVIGVIALALPSLLSTQYGNRLVTGWINSLSSGKVQVEHFHIGWLGSQKIKGFAYKPKDRVTLSAKSFDTDTSLFYLLFGGRHFGKTTIEAPFYHYAPTESEQEKKKKKASSKSQRKASLPRFEALYIKDGRALLSPPNITPIEINQIELSYDEKGVHLSAATQQGTTGGTLTVKGNEELLTADIKNLPVAFLDELCATCYFSDALGQDLSLKIEASQKEQMHIQADIQSQNLQGRLSGVVVGSAIELSGHNSLTYSLSPSFFHQLILPDERGNWSLADRTAFTIDLTKGIFPLMIRDWKRREIVLEGDITLDRSELIHKELGPYSIQGFKTHFYLFDQLLLQMQAKVQGVETSDLKGELRLHDGELRFEAKVNEIPFTLLELVLENASRLKELVGKNSAFTLDGSYKKETLDTHFSLLSQALQCVGSIEGNPTKTLSCEVKGEKNFEKTISEWVGESASFEFDFDLSLAKRALYVPKLKGAIFNPNFAMEIKGSLGEKGKAFDFRSMDITFNGNISNLELQEGASIQKGSLKGRVDGAKNSITGEAKLDALVQTAERTLSSKALEMEFSLNNIIQDNELSLAKSTFRFQADL